MNILRNPWRLAAACGLVLLVATACYQNIDENGNPAALSMGLPTATVTPFPTATDTPTPTEEFAAEVATEETPPEATFDLFPSETPTFEFTFDDPNETPSLLDFDTLQLTFNAPPPQDVLLGDVGGPFGTPTPTPIVIVQIDNFSLTSTQFVLDVTQTQEASFTQTAVALGIGEEPTFPPFATDAPDVFFPTPTPTPFDIGRPAVCIHIVQPGENLFLFSYDWRQDNVASAQRLAAQLRSLRQAYGGTVEIDLVCQSNGGYICRWLGKYGDVSLE